VSQLLRDVRHALRRLRASPGFTAVAVLVLALGIGANTAIFSLVNAFLLRPLPGAEEGVLYGLFSRDRTKADAWRTFSYPNYRDIREGADVFGALMAQDLSLVGIREGETTRRAMGALVSANYFRALGVRIADGREFLDAEEEPNSDVPVAVLSHGYAERRSLGVGDTVVVNTRALTVVGIAPRGFAGTMSLVSPEIWMPLGLYGRMTRDTEGTTTGQLADRGHHALLLAGRLRPGVTPKAAEERLGVLAEGLERAFPAENKDQTLSLHPMARLGVAPRPMDDGWLVAPAVLLPAMAGVVLLVACLNLANMLLARGEARRKEIAIRLAIGGGERRILRQLLTEALVLALLGGAAGLLLARWASAWLVATVVPLLPIELVYDGAPDVRVLAATLAFCVLSTIAFALGPALRLVRRDPALDLKEQAGDGRGAADRRRLSPRNLLVAAQVALSLVLVTAAGLFIQGARRAAEADPGFTLDGGVVAELDPSLAGQDEPRSRETYRVLLERARRLPGVEAASLATTVPFGFISQSRRVAPAGRPLDGEEALVVSYDAVGADYFRTLGLEILRGRDFRSAEEREGGGANVAIVSEPLAARLWPGQDPLGQTIQVRRTGAAPAAFEVVGVVPGLRQDMFDKGPGPHVYAPLGSHFQPNLNLHVRARAGAAGTEAVLVEELRRQIRAVDPALPVVQLRTLRAHRDASLELWTVRTFARLFSAFGLLALVLAVVGVYGVRSYLVARRTREFGIRMALGATTADVRRLVLSEGLRVLSVGLGIGLVLAALVAQGLSRLLYEVSAVDPTTFVLAPLLLGLATLAACELPARRATRVAPVTALRHE
jgi:predicted permease